METGHRKIICTDGLSAPGQRRDEGRASFPFDVRHRESLQQKGHSGVKNIRGLLFPHRVSSTSV